MNKGSNTSDKIRSSLPSEEGSALVEGVFGIIVLLVLLAGTIEFGWAYFSYVALQNAAGEGAAYGMIHPEWHYPNSSTPYSANPNNIEYRVRTESNSSLVNWDEVTVNVDADFPTPGNLISVEVVYVYEPLTPLTAAVLGEHDIVLRAVAYQTIISADSS